MAEGPSRGSDVLAFTTTYGERTLVFETIQDMRAKAGMWFDWLVCAGRPGPELRSGLEEAHFQPDGAGLQHLCIWPENRGQHHGTRVALQLAREMGYRWLLRIDDDIRAKTKRWLRKLVDQTVDLQKRAKDPHERIVSAPRIVGLINPLQASGVVELEGQSYPAELMTILGGGVRLHPVALLAEYEPPLLEPLGRGDPQSIADYVQDVDGLLVRFPNIRVVHHTRELEAQDSPEQAIQRRMSRYWPFLAPPVEEP